MVKNKNQEVRENRRQQIMQTAMELFVEKGFVTASVSDIAKKCGISKGLMYNYFESKDALLKAILDDGMARIYGDYELPEPFDRAALHHFLDFSYAKYHEQSTFFRLYMSMIMQPQIYEVAVNSGQKERAIAMAVYNYFINNFENGLEEYFYFSTFVKGLNVLMTFHDESYPYLQMIERIKSQY